MMSLPTFAPTALADTHSVISDEVLGFSPTEKIGIAKMGLFLSEQKALNIVSLGKAITTFSRKQISDVVRAGCIKWATNIEEIGQLSVNYEYSGNAYAYVNIESSRDNELALVGGIESNPKGYDVALLKHLAPKDRELVLKAISGIRCVLLSAVVDEELEDFSGWLSEDIDTIKSLIPKRLHKNADAMQEYISSHPDKFEDIDIYGDLDDAVMSLSDRQEKRPAWFKKVHQSNNKLPSIIIRELQNGIKKTHHPDVITFIKLTLKSLSDYMRHFEDDSAWQAQSVAAHEIRNEDDNPAIEYGFVICCGSDGYWWTVAESFHEQLMEAGEVPRYEAEIDSPHNRTTYLRYIEGVTRGGFLLNKMVELTDAIEKSNANLPINQSVQY